MSPVRGQLHVRELTELLQLPKPTLHAHGVKSLVPAPHALAAHILLLAVDEGRIPEQNMQCLSRDWFTLLSLARCLQEPATL